MPTHFRALEQQGHANRKDEILRAAVSAFVALSKPNRRDCNQIEDLSLPILPFASEQTKRFICAALAENRSAPGNLVRRLCDEPVAICSPLLLLSPVLESADLVAVIGRMGIHHARIVARRSHLPGDVIEALALVDDERVRARAAGGTLSSEKTTGSNVRPTTAAQARALLSDLAMSLKRSEATLPAAANFEDAEPTSVANTAKLVRLVLHEDPGLFATAVADATGLAFGKVQRLVKRVATGELLTVLRALGINVDTAFVILCALNPHIGANRLEIRLFRDRFEQIDKDKAIETLRRWKADEISAQFKRRAVNSDQVIEDDTVLTA